MDHRSRRRVGDWRRRRRIDHRGPRSSARKQSQSDSRCGRNSKDFAHSRDPPGRAGLRPRQKVKPEGLPEGHEPRAPIGIGSEGGVSRDVRFGSILLIKSEGRAASAINESAQALMRIFRALRAPFANQNFVARCPESFLNSIGHKQSLMVAVTTSEKCQ
jgi:hypothetical protein